MPYRSVRYLCKNCMAEFFEKHHAVACESIPTPTNLPKVGDKLTFEEEICQLEEEVFAETRTGTVVAVRLVRTKHPDRHAFYHAALLIVKIDVAEDSGALPYYNMVLNAGPTDQEPVWIGNARSRMNQQEFELDRNGFQLLIDWSSLLPEDLSNRPAPPIRFPVAYTGSTSTL